MIAKLIALLDRDPREWRAELDGRYGTVLDDVLDGRRRAIVYPAGRMGRYAASRLSAMGVDLVGFGDRSAELQDTTVDGLGVRSPAEIAASHARDVILVASTIFDSHICEELRARGCEFVVPVAYLVLRLPDVFRARELTGAWDAAADTANRPAIEAAGRLFADNESRRVFTGKLAFYLTLDKVEIAAIRTGSTIYFDETVYQLSDDEVVVDGGAYVGDTLTAFLERCAGRFRAYYAFEPDPANFPPLAAMAARDPRRIIAVSAGLGSLSLDGRLLSLQGFDSRILGNDELGGESVAVVALDKFFERARPTPSLIKMDIEGMEAQALEGAAGVIQRVGPVLAISAYHFPADLWAIPLLMARLFPEARLYLRHYTTEFDDTVCYAVPASRVIAS
jgi:FkbM family methyltransferase